MLPSESALRLGHKLSNALWKGASSMNINRVVLTGNLTEGSGHAHRIPARGCRSASSGSRSTRAARTTPPATGRTRPTSSTSPCSAARPRAAGTSSRRAARWRSTAGSSGASTRWRDRSASPSISSLRTCSSSAAATTLATGTGMATPAASAPPESDIPADTSDFEAAPVGCRSVRRRHPVLGNRPRLIQQPSR